MPIIYYNGKTIDSSSFQLSVEDRGLLLGDGLFETIRIYNGHALLLDRHWQRLVQSANKIYLQLPISYLELKTAIAELLIGNDLHAKDAVVRFTVTRGSGPRGLLPPLETKPTILLMVFPLVKVEKKVMTLHISTILRNEHSPLAQIKSLNYLDNILARMEAEQQGADEALLVNTAGNVTCASAANFFMVKKDILYTPSIEDGVLPGITRAIVLEIAQKQGLGVKVGTLSKDKIVEADEVFITNSLLGILPINYIDASKMGAGCPGEITKQLQQEFQNHLNGLRKNYDN